MGSWNDCEGFVKVLKDDKRIIICVATSALSDMG